MAATALSALLLTGCGLLGSPVPSRSAFPGRSTASRSARTGALSAGALAQIARTHELATPSGRVTVAGGWRAPAQAVAAFAAAYVNWTAATVAGRLRGLASVSVGQARSAMLTEAAEVADDRELRAGGIANSGIVEAVAPVRGSPLQYAVVTRERTTAADDAAYAGLQPAWHVALATVARTRTGWWVVSQWQPES